MMELLSPLVIKLLFGEQYIESISVFQILLVAFTFGVIINSISLVMYSINKAYLLTAMNWIQLPLNYFGNLLLIPMWQADGAAISTTILRILGGLYIMVYLLKVRK
jgi:O-antigen/teichoic acid export membrane protein